MRPLSEGGRKRSFWYDYEFREKENCRPSSDCARFNRYTIARQHTPGSKFQRVHKTPSKNRLVRDSTSGQSTGKTPNSSHCIHDRNESAERRIKTRLRPHIKNQVTSC